MRITKRLFVLLLGGSSIYSNNLLKEDMENDYKFVSIGLIIFSLSGLCGVVYRIISCGRRQNSLLTVQSATVNDLESLAQLYEELSGEKTNLYKMKENFKLMELNKDYVVLIAKDGDLIVGTVMGIICFDLVGECKSFMVIENVIVKCTWQGRGIGKMLMKEIEEIGRKRDCYYTMFVSSGHRKEAHKFYEAIGYDLDFVQGFKKFL